jgi:hypothetical protein
MGRNSMQTVTREIVVPAGFISVGERLPTRRDGRLTATKVHVLAQREHGGVHEAGFYIAGPGGGWDDSDLPGMRVTHWLPTEGQS